MTANVIEFGISENAPGSGWHWEVFKGNEVIARGIANTHAAAREQASRTADQSNQTAAPVTAAR